MSNTDLIQIKERALICLDKYGTVIPDELILVIGDLRDWVETELE